MFYLRCHGIKLATFAHLGAAALPWQCYSQLPYQHGRGRGQAKPSAGTQRPYHARNDPGSLCIRFPRRASPLTSTLQPYCITSATTLPIESAAPDGAHTVVERDARQDGPRQHREAWSRKTIGLPAP